MRVKPVPRSRDAPLVEAGEGVNMSFLVKRQSKEKILSKIAQTEQALDTAQPYSGSYKELITRQVESPVQWQKTVENLIDLGVDTFIEVGVGKTLAGLIKKINKEVKVFNVENKETLEALSI